MDVTDPAVEPVDAIEPDRLGPTAVDLDEPDGEVLDPDARDMVSGGFDPHDDVIEYPPEPVALDRIIFPRPTPPPGW